MGHAAPRKENPREGTACRKVAPYRGTASGARYRSTITGTRSGRWSPECRSILQNVVVVDDGSTDADVAALLSGLDVVVLKHEKNLGKGQAILTASRYVEEQGGVYMITIDADGQHAPQDIEKFIPLMREDEPAIIIGCRDFNTENVPASSRFGRSFANFWLKVETGRTVDDCQSGFRAYPVSISQPSAIQGLALRFRGRGAGQGGLGRARAQDGTGLMSCIRNQKSASRTSSRFWTI